MTTIFSIHPSANDNHLKRDTMIINGYSVEVDTYLFHVTITGATCHSCCDHICDEKKNKRHTFSSVFNELKRLNKLPDNSKLLELFYINMDKNSLSNVEESDSWWKIILYKIINMLILSVVRITNKENFLIKQLINDYLIRIYSRKTLFHENKSLLL